MTDPSSWETFPNIFFRLDPVSPLSLSIRFDSLLSVRDWKTISSFSGSHARLIEGAAIFPTQVFFCSGSEQHWKSYFPREKNAGRFSSHFDWWERGRNGDICCQTKRNEMTNIRLTSGWKIVCRSKCKILRFFNTLFLVRTIVGSVPSFSERNKKTIFLVDGLYAAAR